MTRGWNLLSCFLLLLIGCTLSVSSDHHWIYYRYGYRRRWRSGKPVLP